MSFGDAAGSVVASCYIQYIALDIAAIPPLQVSFAFALASLTKCAVALVFWSGLTYPLDRSRALLLAVGLAKAATLYVAIIATKGLVISNSRHEIVVYACTTLMAYNICAQICREMRGVMGLTAPKSSLGLIAGTVLPPLIASDGTEPWGNIQRLAVAAACITVVSLGDTNRDREPRPPHLRTVSSVLVPLRRRHIGRMLAAVCLSQLAAAMLVSTVWIYLKYCVSVPLWGSESKWSSTNAVLTAGFVLGGMHIARCSTQLLWARVAAKWGAVPTWRLSGATASGLLWLAKLAAAADGGVAALVLIVLSGGAAGCIWSDPSGVATAAMASSVPPASSSDQQNRRVSAIEKLVGLSQVTAWGMQACFVGGLLHHIDFVPSIEPSQQQQAAIHWIVFGGPALLLAISAALPPTEKRERKSRRMAKGNGTAPLLKDGTQRPKAD